RRGPGMTRHHLTDTELLALHFDTQPDGDAHTHMAGCTTCQSRGRAVTELLDGVTRATADETDALFGADLLARQHSRIMSRVALECRSARIISFPASTPAPVRHARGGTRWVAAAVAAGVILGIVGEQLTERIARSGRPRRVHQLGRRLLRTGRARLRQRGPGGAAAPRRAHAAGHRPA